MFKSEKEILIQDSESSTPVHRNNLYQNKKRIPLTGKEFLLFDN